MSSPIHRLSAKALAALVRAGELSPAEVLSYFAERLARLNPELNAVVTPNVPAATRRAEALDATLRRGNALPPLAGVPFLVKDVYDTAGLRTTYGSPRFAEHVPNRDAHAVRQLKSAGGLLLGKTNTAELAFGFLTENPVFGATTNPWDATRLVGGSSGGDAAAVAAGLAPLAIGSDLAGSVRVPAHCNGVVGFRPTPGRVSTDGHGAFGTPLLAEMVAPGIFARHVEDVALALQALQGHHYLDPFSETIGDARPGNPPGRMKCAIIDFASLSSLDRAVERGLVEASMVLGGARRALALRFALEKDLLPTFKTLAGAGLRTRLARALGPDHGLDDARLFVAALPDPDVDQLQDALGKRMLIATLAGSLLESHDVLLLPVLRGAAPLATAPEARTSATLLDEGVANLLAVLAGLPSLTVPVGVDSYGMPVAIQILGRRGADLAVLAAGIRLQAVLGLELSPAACTDLTGGHKWAPTGT